MSTFFLLGLLALGLLVTATIALPEIAIAIQLVGTMFAAVAVHYIGLEAGVLYSIFGLMVLAVLVHAFRSPLNLTKLTLPELAALGLAATLAISLLYSTAPIYGRAKVLRFFGICVPLILACRIFSSTRLSMARTLKWLALASILVTVLYMLIFLADRRLLTVADRFGAGTSSLLLSWTCASAAALITYLIISTTSLWTKFLAGFTVLCSFILIVASGSRAPFLALLGSAALTFLGRRALLRGLTVLLLLTSVSTVALFYLAPEAGRDRILTVFREGAYRESGRSSLVERALLQFRASPLKGGGAGSFARFAGAGDHRYYAHNMLAEIAGETGAIGLACAALMLASCVKPLLRLRSRSEPMWAVGKTIQLLFWIGLANAMVSFDIPEQRALFSAVGLLAAVRRWPPAGQSAGLNTSRLQFAPNSNRLYVQDAGIQNLT